MLTLEKITELHDHYGTMDTFSKYIEGLRDMGVERYDSYVHDGHSEFFGGSSKVASPPQHKGLRINEVSDKGLFFENLGKHLQRKTSYLEMSTGMAESGVEKWTVDITRMTMTYYDKKGKKLLVESITTPD